MYNLKLHSVAVIFKRYTIIIVIIIVIIAISPK